jgi:hypothetical protein
VKHADSERGRYDRDPIHRIEKRLKQNARDRRVRLERRILASKQEDESLGKVSLEG